MTELARRRCLSWEWGNGKAGGNEHTDTRFGGPYARPLLLHHITP